MKYKSGHFLYLFICIEYRIYICIYITEDACPCYRLLLSHTIPSAPSRPTASGKVMAAAEVISGLDSGRHCRWEYWGWGELRLGQVSVTCLKHDKRISLKLDTGFFTGAY